jgi:hypothetical protein
LLPERRLGGADANQNGLRRLLVDESFAGQQVVGLDLHRRRTVMVRMIEAGERLEAVRFVWDPAVLAEQIAKAGPSPEVVVEASYNWVRREGA